MIRRFYIMPLNHRATPENVARFVSVYDACDEFIPGLLASAAGLDLDGKTVVWENVFVDEETYTGPYMVHPYHSASLDSYLMGDSPELLTHDIFTVRYEYPGEIPRIESGFRRLVLLKMADEVEAVARDVLSEGNEHVATAVFSKDNVQWVSPKGKAWTHILEQGFADREALDAYLLTAHGIGTSSKDGLRQLGIDADDLKVFTYPFSLKPAPQPAPMPADDEPAFYAITARLAIEDVDTYIDLLESSYDKHMTDCDATLVQRLRSVEQGSLDAEVQSIWQLPSMAHYNKMRFSTGADPNWLRYARETVTLVKGGTRRFYRAV